MSSHEGGYREYSIDEEKKVEVNSPTEAAEKLKETMLKTLTERFDKDGIMPKPFHRKEHSIALMHNGLELFDKLAAVDPAYVANMSPESWKSLPDDEKANLLEEERTYYVALSLGHDIRQDSMTVGDKLTRFRGVNSADSAKLISAVNESLSNSNYSAISIRGNEETSADEIYEEISKYTDLNGKPIFSRYTRNRVHQDINATLPEFTVAKVPGHESTGLRVYQPYNSSESSSASHILGMVDLRFSYGHMQDTTSMYCGDLEFWELNEPIRKKLEEKIANSEEFTQDEMVSTTNLILKWMDSQPSFMLWQEHESAFFLNDLEASGVSSEVVAVYKEFFFGEDGRNFQRNASRARGREQLIQSGIFGILDGPKLKEVKEIEQESFLALLDSFSFDNLWEPNLSGYHLVNQLNKAYTPIQELKEKTGSRELTLHEDVTDTILLGIHNYPPQSAPMKDFNIFSTHTDYLMSRPLSMRWHEAPPTLAVNLNTVGASESLPTATPLDEGHMATLPSSNFANTSQSRAFLFRTYDPETNKPIYTMLKGTGVRTLAENPNDVSNQFGRYNKKYSQEDARRTGWGSVGGVLESNVWHELNNSMCLADLYYRLYGEMPSIRSPKKVYEISASLKNEGADDLPQHFQVEYELRTPVRSGFSEYLSDLGKFWIGIDLETAKGKEHALDTLNEMLCAYPSLHSDTKLNKLTKDDIEPAITVLKEYEAMFIDTDKDLADESVAKKRYELALTGHALATKFYEQNTEAVEKALYEELTSLSKMVGLTSALGLQMHSTVSSKDAYGGEIADLDCVLLRPGYALNLEKKYFDDAVVLSIHNAVQLTALMGLPRERQMEFIETYIESVNANFRQTLENIEDLNLTANSRLHLKDFHNQLASALEFDKSSIDTQLDKLGLKKDTVGWANLKILMTFVQANADILREKFQIEIQSPIQESFYRGFRRPIGQESVWTSRDADNSRVQKGSQIYEGIDEQEEFFEVKIIAKEKLLTTKVIPGGS